MKKIALIDCNNFFVSCERVFNPKIRNKPTMVLSGNDGCVVARSQKVKDLGIKTGQPVFQVKDLIRREKINLISGNLELYRDMSRRVMNIVREFVEEIEVYSIDEVFLDITDKKNPEKFCQEIQDTLKRYTGIPVSIGIAPTKTLAKLANKVAKKNGEIFHIKNNKILVSLLKNTKPADIWGIGKRNAEKLEKFGIKTAYDFCQQNENWVKSKFSVRAVELIQELQGYSVENVLPTRAMRKSIISSKSFSQKVFDLNRLTKSVVVHIEKATKQLREEEGVAQNLKIYISTGPHQKNENYYGEDVIEFETPTDDTIEMIKQVDKVLKKIYKKGFGYKKSGICLSGIIPKSKLYENNLFGEMVDSRQEVNMTIDKINQKYGENTIGIASGGRKEKNQVPKWINNPKFRSQRYTTRWEEILTSE